MKIILKTKIVGTDTDTYPIWHFMGVGKSMMVVEDHDSGDNTRGHHEHDAVEVST